jgi:hypothetical protein
MEIVPENRFQKSAVSNKLSVISFQVFSAFCCPLTAEGCQLFLTLS